MPSLIPAVLLYQGHSAQIGTVSTLQEVWLSSNLRPEIEGTFLPALGDSPITGNVIAGQTIISSLSSLTCKTVTEEEYLEGGVRGTVYGVSYDNIIEDDDFRYTSIPRSEPTNNSNTVILRISGGASTETYIPNDKSTSKMTVYDTDTLSGYTEFRDPIPLIYCTTNIETTKRQRNKSFQDIINYTADAGKLNAATMWGQPIGNVLFTGCNADPVQEFSSPGLSGSAKEINWNVTNRYQIRHLPGVDDNTFNHINFKGKWRRVRNSAGVDIEFYEKGTLPDDMT